MRAWAYPSKDGPYLVKRTSAWLPEDDTSGDNHSNLCSGCTGTGNRQFASDSLNPLVHSPQTEVSFCTVISSRRVDANTIVFDAQSKIVAIFQLNFQSTPL